MKKWVKIFTFAYGQDRRGCPPFTVCSFVFYDSPKLLIEFQHKMHESVVVLFYNDL